MTFCTEDTRYPVYIGYENPMVIVPVRDTRTQEEMDLSGLTEAEVCIGGVTVNSTDEPTMVFWEEQQLDPDDAALTWVLVFRPGLFPGIVTGEFNASIVVYDGDYPGGLVITNDLPVEVVPFCQ